MTVRVINRNDPEPAAVAFDTWLAKAGKGEQHVYHRGEHAWNDRWVMVAQCRSAERDPALTIYTDLAGGAAHKAYLDGLVHLVQRRAPLGDFEYVAVRR